MQPNWTRARTNLLFSVHTQVSVRKTFWFQYAPKTESPCLLLVFLPVLCDAGKGCMKPGWTRASLKFVTSIEEVDYLVAAVKQVGKTSVLRGVLLMHVAFDQHRGGGPTGGSCQAGGVRPVYCVLCGVLLTHVARDQHQGGRLHGGFCQAGGVRLAHCILYVRRRRTMYHAADMVRDEHRRGPFITILYSCV